MMRKLIVVLIVGAISLLGITPVLAQEVYELNNYEKLIGKKLTFNEAPELRIKVAAGELPPVEERLPEEPLVVKPLEKIGQYGGTWHRANLGVISLGVYLTERLVCWNLGQTKLLPNVAKSWKYSQDGKSITFTLRKGMKWSDGAPFTADDFVFGWNDILLNKDINPLTPSWAMVNGEPGKIKKINEYTFKLTFSGPYGSLIEDEPVIYAPEHYLKQFHPKYTSMEKIKQIMKKEGFTNWTDLFKARANIPDIRDVNPKCPVIKAWYPLDAIGAAIQRYARNPYYWKVDTEGNQLPYIDNVHETLMSDAETILLKALAGELDYQGLRVSSLQNYPICKQNEKKGNYRVVPWMCNVGTNYGALYFNFFHKDPVVRKLFRNKKFRIALSLAINRDEINGLLFKGLATPSQSSPSKDTVWYNEKLAKQYTKYKPNEANRILDEIGLTKRDAQGYRLRPDGKRLQFVISAFTPWPPENVEISNLIKEYWEKIGIKIVVKPVARQLWTTQVAACEYDIASYAINYGFDRTQPPANYSPVVPIYEGSGWCQKWALWLGSGGKEGEEPPADVKRLWEIHNEYPTEISLEKRTELNNEAIEIHGRNLWDIGIVQEVPLGRFFIVKNNIGNATKNGKEAFRNARRSVPDCIAMFFFKK